MRYLSRTKVYQKIELLKEAKKVYIFCEGEVTEVKYFKYFKGLSSNIDIIPIPNDNGKSDPLKLKQNADLLFFGNKTNPPKFHLNEVDTDEIWFVIDTDEWNEGNKIQQLKEYCISKNTINNKWSVVQSNPCFEMWLYFHFNEIKPTDADVAQFGTFKEYVNDKIKGGFDNRSMPIELESAIINSLTNFEYSNDQPMLYSTDVHKLGEVIIPFVKTQMDKAREMMQYQEARQQLTLDL